MTNTPEIIFRGTPKKFTRTRLTFGDTPEKVEMVGYEYKGVKIIVTPEGIVVE